MVESCGSFTYKKINRRNRRGQRHHRNKEGSTGAKSTTAGDQKGTIKAR